MILKFQKRYQITLCNEKQPDYSTTEINSLTFSKDSLKEITVDMDL